MSATKSSNGILAEDAREERERIVEMLTKAYWMEIETVMSYLANSVNPDGVRAQEIIKSLREDIQEELGHATQFANRIKELYGIVPGSMDFAGRTVLPAAARASNGHRARHQGRDRGRDRRDRLLQRDHRGDRGDRSRHQRHGDRDPPRRGGPPPPVRGVPARVPRPAVSSTTATGMATTEERAQAQPRSALSFTFDDGPDETWTPRVLKQLARCEVTATFFMVGERVRAHPDLARTVLAAGHDIQLHCDRHIRHTELTEAELQLDTELALDAAGHSGRAPAALAGRRGESAPTRAFEQPRQVGLQLVRWSIDTHDWRGDQPHHDARRYRTTSSLTAGRC